MKNVQFVLVLLTVFSTCYIKINAQSLKIVSARKVSNDSGKLGNILPANERFGYRLRNMGDLNGDGIPDFVSTVPDDTDGGFQRGGFYFIYMNQDGTVKGKKKYSQDSGGLGFTFPSDNYLFGYAVENMGDLDGNGVSDFAVSALGDSSNTGSLYILFMNKDGTVKSHTYMNENTPILSSYLTGGNAFGADLANLGDVDGDGVPDLAVAALYDQNYSGAIYILFMKTDGTIKGVQRIGNGSGNLGLVLNSGDEFGGAVAALGDIDGDGIPDVLIGAQGKSSAYIATLNRNGTVKKLIRFNDSTNIISNNSSLAFGNGVASLPDMNGDGIKDILIAAPGDVNGGSAYIIMLDSTHNMKSNFKICDTTPGFQGYLSGVDLLGDGGDAYFEQLNSNTKAIGVSSRSDPDGNTNAGAFYVIYLQPTTQSINSGTTNIVALDSIGLATDTLCGDWSPVSVEIKNLADSVISTFPLIVILSGDTQIIDTIIVNQSIRPGQSYIYNFSGPMPTFKNKIINKLTIVANVPGNTKSKDDTVQAKIQYIPISVGFSAPDVCLGTATQFTNTSQGAISSYSWDFGDSAFRPVSGDSSTLANPSHIYTKWGQYTVTLFIQAPGGCGTVTQHIINVDTFPSAAFTISGACTGDTIYFKDTANNTSQASLFYKWYFGDGDTSNAAKPIHFYTFPGIYTASLKIKNSAGCSDSVAHIDTIYALPIAQFVSLNDSTLQASNGSKYQWYKNGQALLKDTNSQLIIDTGGSYAVEITNGRGCSSLSPAQELQGPPPTLYIPNAFTPGNKGVNDTFRAKGASVDNFQMQIYNRWGEMVFQSNDMNKGWDGTYQGQASPVGYYFYMVQYWGYETRVMVQNGLLWLIR